MSALQKLEVVKKKKSVYSSSVMWLGTTKSYKFYLKDDEFYAHDFKELKKLGFHEEAYNLYQQSQGVLRFEITLRKQAIAKILPYYDIFRFESIEAILQKSLREILHSNGQAVLLDEIAQKLVDKYGKAKGIHLYGFYKVYFGEYNGRTKLKKYLKRGAVWYNLKKLSEANVGLETHLEDTNFNLTIPSEYIVNALPPPKGGGKKETVLVTPSQRSIK